MRRYLLCAGLLAGVAVVAWAAGNRAAARDAEKPADAKPAAAKPAAAKPAVAADADLIIGEPIRYANLTIFPLSSRSPKTENRFTTLDEGLKDGTVRVMEINARGVAEANRANLPNVPAGNRAANLAPARPAAQQAVAGLPAVRQQPAAQQEAVDPFGNSPGADVNHLAIVNHSKKPLYLMPGEIIVGGQQDRTIANEYVIPPGKKPTTIEVFCVEHGRWVGRGAGELRAIARANDNLALNQSVAIAGSLSLELSQTQSLHGAPAPAAKPDAGQFIGSLGAVNKAARIAVQGDKDQSKVWSKVGEINALNGNTVTTGDFAGNYLEKKSVERLEPYYKAMSKKVADTANVVGAAVAIDGKMDTLDVFESTPLFRKLWPKLLKSYALDAVNAAEEAASQKPDPKAAKTPQKACSVDDARKFLAEVTQTRSDKATTNGDVAVTTASTKHILCVTSRDSRRVNEASGASGMGMGGFSGAIHAFGGSK